MRWTMDRTWRTGKHEHWVAFWALAQAHFFSYISMSASLSRLTMQHRAI